MGLGLSRFIKLINEPSGTISKREFAAALYTRKRTGFFITHAIHVFEAAVAVTNETDDCLLFSFRRLRHLLRRLVFIE